MLIREVSLEADISRFCRSSHIVYIAPFCYNYSVEKWEEIALTQIWVILIQMHPLNIKCTQRAAEAQFFMPDWENAPNK